MGKMEEEHIEIARIRS